MKILIVDDSSDDRRLLRYIIEKKGHEAVEAEDGLDGLRMAKLHRPDLIISDALMPLMDGFQFLRAAKEDETIRSIPFIFYSAIYKADKDVDLALELGAEAYIIKPKEPAEFWEEVEIILQSRKTETIITPELIKEDEEYLKRYSQVVAAKLEEKVRELELTLAERKLAGEALQRSEQHLREVYEYSPLAYQSLDVNGKYIDINPAWCAMTGYAREEVIGRTFADFLTPASIVLLQERFPCFQAQGEMHGIEFEMVRKDGSHFEIELNGRIGYDEQGNFRQTYCTLIDITERKKAERERLANLKFFESMDKVNRAMQGANDLQQMMSDVLGVVISVFNCDRAYIVYPCDPEAVSYHVPMERTTPKYPGALAKGIEVPIDAETIRVFRTLLGSDDPVTFGPGSESALPLDLTKYFGVHSQAAMAVYPKGDKPYMFGVHQCSCPRIWTAEETKLLREIGRRLADALTSLLSHRGLQGSEARYRRIVDTAIEGIWVLGPDTTTTLVNARMADMLGYAAGEMVGLPFTDFMFDEDLPDHQRRMENRRQGLSETYERRFRRKDGNSVWTLVSASPILDEEHRLTGSFGMFTDITKRKRAEDALRESEAFVRKILETVDEGFIVIDRNYRILSANKAFCSSAKLSEEQVLGKYCYEVSHHINKPCFDAGEDCAVRRTFESGVPHTVSHTHVSEGGEKCYVEIKSYPVMDASGNVISAIETITDVTEKKKLEEQLRHAQKLEALGTLAGGVAHDFNNILTAIFGFGGIMKMQMSMDDPNLRYIREILAASERAAHLTRSLLIFSRRQPAELKPLNVNDLVNGMNKMLLRLIGEDIETNLALSPEILVVMGDYGQLEQVLMNFVTNARDAMPDGGILTIKTENCEMDGEFAHMHGFDRPGKYALISVSDTGKGMDEKTRERIFEPFFTTKEIGKGTGLGLAIVYGIVKQHNGYINCYSEPDKGTVFKVYLPLIREEFLEAEEEGPVTVQGGSETILIADDDEITRNFVKELLEKYGYTVLEANDGEDAVSKFMNNRDKIQLLLFDVIMPRKSGKEAFEEIRAIQPDIKALFFSGYTEDIIRRKRIIEEKLLLLHKPVKPQELLAKIRECLDAT